MVGMSVAGTLVRWPRRSRRPVLLRREWVRGIALASAGLGLRLRARPVFFGSLVRSRLPLLASLP